MFLFIKNLFKKKKALACCFRANDINGNEIIVCENKIVAARAPTKKDWKFRGGTEWGYKGKKYILKHSWEIVEKKEKNVSKKPTGLAKRKIL